jgi:Biopolymer transport protein ExbD/TolR
MGMGGGGTGGAVSEINVTPLIDVLLVLLIIFMVIVPVTPRGLETLVPQPPKEHKEEPQNDRTIVVQVQSNGAAAPAYKINEQGPGLQQSGRGHRLWACGWRGQYRPDYAKGRSGSVRLAATKTLVRAAGRLVSRPKLFGAGWCL